MKALVVLLLSMTVVANAKDKLKLGFSNESEVGYVVTGGNSESETTSVKQTNKYQWSRDLLQFTGHYIQSSGQVDSPTATNPNNQITQTTAENWATTLRFERVLTPKWFNAFISHGWRGDRFQGVNAGHDSDIGAKYYTANSDTYKQFFELGYRYTRELLKTNPCTDADPETLPVGVGDCGYPEFHYVRIYAKADYEYSKSFTVGAWIEYLPSVTNFSKDQRINYSPYITSVLTDIFSLKVSYEGRYRHEKAPGATRNTDFTFTTALLAKF